MFFFNKNILVIINYNKLKQNFTEILSVGMISHEKCLTIKQYKFLNINFTVTS